MDNGMYTNTMILSTIKSSINYKPIICLGQPFSNIIVYVNCDCHNGKYGYELYYSSMSQEWTPCDMQYIQFWKPDLIVESINVSNLHLTYTPTIL